MCSKTLKKKFRRFPGRKICSGMDALSVSAGKIGFFQHLQGCRKPCFLRILIFRQSWGGYRASVSILTFSPEHFEPHQSSSIFILGPLPRIHTFFVENLYYTMERTKGSNRGQIGVTRVKKSLFRNRSGSGLRWFRLLVLRVLCV